MTTENMIFNGATTVAVANYNNGTFDASGSQGYVNLTLTPDGSVPPNNNLSTVIGSFGGMSITFDPASPLPTDAAHDGSETALRYCDSVNDNTGAYTGQTTIVVKSNASLNIGQLHGGENSWFDELASQNKALSVGAQVAAAGGTYIDLLAGSTGSVYIEADVQSFTLIDNLTFNGKQVLEVDLPSAGSAVYFNNVTLTATSGSVAAVFITPWPPSLMGYFAGILVTGITASALQAKMVRNGAYLAFH